MHCQLFNSLQRLADLDSEKKQLYHGYATLQSIYFALLQSRYFIDHVQEFLNTDVATKTSAGGDEILIIKPYVALARVHVTAVGLSNLHYLLLISIYYKHYHFNFLYSF